MPLVDLALPILAATVFTLVGYGILRAGRHAKAIGGVLEGTFVVCALMALMALFAQMGDRHGDWIAKPTQVVQGRGG